MPLLAHPACLLDWINIPVLPFAAGTVVLGCTFALLELSASTVRGACVSLAEVNQIQGLAAYCIAVREFR